MNTKMNAFPCLQKRSTLLSGSRRRKGVVILLMGLPALLFGLASFGQRGPPGGGGARGGVGPHMGGVAPHAAPAPARPAVRPPGPAMVERPTHGTIRHLDTHTFQRPVVVNPEPQRRIEPGHEFDNR